MKKKEKKIRLNKYIADCGLCSRRYADNLIKLGKIKINNKIITNFNEKLYDTDKISYNNIIIYPNKKIYIILNKPIGVISTTNDEKNRKTVIDLIPKNLFNNKRIYPIGRLDYKTTGVLLLSNDGLLTNKLLSPKYNIKKIYNVILSKKLDIIDYNKIKNGINLSEGKAIIDNIKYINYNEIMLELHIGWNRIIRRIFKILKYKILKLDRISFGGIKINNLKRGEYRFLSKKEFKHLLMITKNK